MVDFDIAFLPHRSGGVIALVNGQCLGVDDNDEGWKALEKCHDLVCDRDPFYSFHSAFRDDGEFNNKIVPLNEVLKNLHPLRILNEHEECEARLDTYRLEDSIFF
jgi:hypothetical protein